MAQFRRECASSLSLSSSLRPAPPSSCVNDLSPISLADAVPAAKQAARRIIPHEEDREECQVVVLDGREALENSITRVGGFSPAICSFAYTLHTRR